MSQMNAEAVKSFPCDIAIAKHTRVKLSSGKLAVAGVAEKELGTLLQQTFALSGSTVNAPVLLRTAQGTCKMLAASAITAGTAVYTAASGKMNDTAATGSFYVGEVLEAAAADGDIVEVLRGAHGDTASA